MNPGSGGKKVLVVKTTSARDIIIAVSIGALVLAFIIWGVLHLSTDVPSKMLTGRIIAKHFKPQPEEQVSVGQGGLYKRDIDGEYTVEVQTSQGKTYTVWVDKTVYTDRQVGDTLMFLPPPSGP